MTILEMVLPKRLGYYDFWSLMLYVSLEDGLVSEVLDLSRV